MLERGKGGAVGLEFEDLPFYKRPDLTPSLIHLTRSTEAEDDYSAFDNLVSILKEGRIWGSTTKKGFIRGPSRFARRKTSFRFLLIQSKSCST
jgi:hypothetical protein